ncbi:hypothetical protein HY483_02065 [Candidatus Woesearchaeota archaeon]|nr:hypothetical protein [Candidatus Woesearchaeota archaeon]
MSAIFAGIKLAVFVFAPGIFVFKTIIPESEDLSVGFVGSSTGVIILGITYYIFGLFGIKFGLSIFLSPIIIIFIVILYLKLKRKVEVETGDYATKKS